MPTRVWSRSFRSWRGGRHGGAEVRRRIASVYSLRAGVVFKHAIYLDRAAALAAAGVATSSNETATIRTDRDG
jgi:hypothetical protein